MSSTRNKPFSLSPCSSVLLLLLPPFACVLRDMLGALPLAAVLCALWLVASAGFQTRINRNPPPLSTLHMALHLKTVQIPLQEDPGKYAELLHEIIAKERLLRWYIVKVEARVCHIDAVYNDDNALPEPRPV